MHAAAVLVSLPRYRWLQTHSLARYESAVAEETSFYSVEVAEGVEKSDSIRS